MTARLLLPTIPYALRAILVTRHPSPVTIFGGISLYITGVTRQASNVDVKRSPIIIQARGEYIFDFPNAINFGK